MSKTQEWKDLSDQYELLFGKKPRSNTKEETLREKIEEELLSRDVEVRSEIESRLNELAELSKKASLSGNGKPVVMAIAASKSGIHSILAGDGPEIAVSLSSVMMENTILMAIVKHSLSVCESRIKQIEEENKEIKTEA